MNGDSSIQDWHSDGSEEDEGVKRTRGERGQIRWARVP